jgi:hypothetical protein
MDDIFSRAKDIALAHVRAWLPDGREESGQWVALNPMRDDKNAGSFKINLFTGAWNDYADDDAIGHDAISLYAYLNGCTNYDAAREIMAKYGPDDYFPSPNDIKIADTWHQLARGHKSPPELLSRNNEIARWPLEIKTGASWRVVMWIVRCKEDDKRKTDYPFTLWSDGKNLEWRAKALKNKYPLYGLRALAERPNARVVLYEGQKTPSVVQSVLGDEWVCAGWYGGAGNAHLTDFDPLIGREVWFSFDADPAGRKAIISILDGIHAATHLVYPPPNVPKGWDHADAIEGGWKREDIERALLGEPAAIAPCIIGPCSPENRPVRLDVPVSQDFREYVMANVFQLDKNGNLKTMSNWPYWIVENDVTLQHCIKYDYTTGVKDTAYDSTEIFEASLEHRLEDMGIHAAMTTKKSKEQLMGRIIIKNVLFNRVTDYMDMLASRHADVTESVLADFMKVFIFKIDKEHGEDEEAYAKRCDAVEELYKELFHKFFFRMHARINGTRKRDDGSYYGLLENDIVPIIEGPQGTGKTTLCRWLACQDELYIDLGSGMKQGFGSAETVKKIRGRLIAEIGEMGSVKKAEVETVKSFISMKAATIDIKFIEGQKDIPMTASFIGTDNNGQYLVDDTGNRRFWPVKIKDIDKAYTSAHQYVPERLHAYYSRITKELNGDKDKILAACRPSKELEAFMDKLREHALITYSDYEVCLKMIREWKTANIMGGELDQADIEKAAFEAKYMTRISSRSFKRAMKDSGFVWEPRYDKNIEKSRMAWTWAPAKEDKSEDAPF